MRPTLFIEQRNRKLNWRMFNISLQNPWLDERMMNTSICGGSERKKTKGWAWITTVAYLIFFPFLLMLALASVMVFDRPNTSILFGLGLILMYFLMPLSIPCTFYLVWSR